MTIGSWDPTATTDASTFEFDDELLRQAISFCEKDDLEAINTLIAPDQLQHHAKMMRLGKEVWTAKAAAFDEAQLIQLIRFFTLAEMKLPGWEAGAESPVIWLVKVLRKRGTPPSRELLVWIKANTNNRFLPNGAL